MSEPARPVLTVISGLSGGGKSLALRTLEDLGYTCVDNLPVALLPDFVRSVEVVPGEPAPKLAVGVDVRARNADLTQLGDWLSAVGALGFDHRLVFFDTTDAVLLKRYAETRRRHPLSHAGLALADAIVLERQMLRPVLALADIVIDTSELNVHQHRRRVITDLGMAQPGLSVLVESFAYRRGVPADADFVFDARALPNPHWDARLRPLSGRDPAVREHLDADPLAVRFRDGACGFIAEWLPRFESETRSYLTVAFGCTGGRHRSVWLAESLAAALRAAGRDDVHTFHREIE